MRLWDSDDVFARAGRAALAPAAGAYRGAIALRQALYASGVLPVTTPAIPAISVGNLTVGGTGKTPVASWIARELIARGAHPAIVLRGYSGGDEVAVHRLLTPGIPVIGDPDRARGIARAARDGADVAVLDDAFQHCQVARRADVVLVSADAWSPHWRLLPAGPWREPLAALSRATAVLVTRKAVGLEEAEGICAMLAGIGIRAPIAIATLSLGALSTLEGGRRPLDALRGETVHAVAGIGAPGAFFGQLAAAGVRVVPHPFRDHHAFTATDAESLVRAAAGAPVVCTLKDAVKLAWLWPRAAEPIWYVSQRVELDRGREAVSASIFAAAP